MTEKITHLWKKKGEPTSGLIHISKLIVFRHLLDFYDLDIERDAAFISDTDRCVNVMPSLQESEDAIIPLLVGDEAEKKISSVMDYNMRNLINHYTEAIYHSGDFSDFFTQEASDNFEQVNNTVLNHFEKLPKNIANEILDNQFPGLKDIPLKDIIEHLSRLDALNGGEVKDEKQCREYIQEVSQKTASMFDEIMKNFCKDYKGSEWVKIERDPSLFLKINQAIDDFKAERDITFNVESKNKAMSGGESNIVPFKRQ